MTNPLQQAQRSGVRMNGRIDDLFADIGNKDHPRGFVATAYRNARRAMTSALAEVDQLSAAREVMGQLKSQVNSGFLSLLGDAQVAGADESARQLRFYDVQSGNTSMVSMSLSAELQSAANAVNAKVEAQERAVIALLSVGMNDAQIVGDEERVGVLSAGEIVAAATFWTTAVLWDSFGWWTGQYAGGMGFQKQAVAAIDSKTTDCCLRVHGQVRDFNSPFTLTGTPRFADEVDWPAFHYYCRTSGVLYLSAYDNGLTARMRSLADSFLAERAAGRNPDRNPSSGA